MPSSKKFKSKNTIQPAYSDIFYEIKNTGRFREVISYENSSNEEIENVIPLELSRDQ
jgi:hypothetical protein